MNHSRRGKEGVGVGRGKEVEKVGGKEQEKEGERKRERE